ncbi:hypothetical protein [Nocardia miyunensis]|uniref:hypothetical protein n=1 Tax=Nocardia miyunensis TaxID=282684 RepID=UPI0012F4A2F6|nr:hypothetical protein [Nocardia miyunensis]
MDQYFDNGKDGIELRVVPRARQVTLDQDLNLILVESTHPPRRDPPGGRGRRQL